MNDELATIVPPQVSPRLTYEGPKGPLFKALAEARKHYLPLASVAQMRFGEGPKARNHDYAPLDVVIDALKPGWDAAGICVSQPFDGDTMYTIVAVGESAMTVSTLLPSWNSSQDLGAILTYFRRYQLKGIFAVADSEDDDGASAPGGQGNPQPRKEPQTAPKSSGPKLDPKVVQLCIDSAKKAGLDKDGFAAACLKATGKKFNEFTGEDAAKFLDTMAHAP